MAMSGPRPSTAADGPQIRALRLLDNWRQLWRLNFCVHARFAGTKLKVPIVFGEGRQNLAQLEWWLLESLGRLFALRDGAFLDVGVNVGQTLLKAKALDRGRPYYGFEPNPRCCQYVEQLIRANRFPRCVLVPAGLSRRCGLAELKWTVESDVDSRASLVEGFWPDTSNLDTRYVTVVDGDAAIDQMSIRSIAVIKIDVEGAELDVVAGLERTLRREQPYVICEILPVVDAATVYGRQRLARQEELLEIFARIGYRLYRVHTDATTEPVHDIDVHADLDLSNYIAVPDAGRPSFEAAFPSRGAARSEGSMSTSENDQRHSPWSVKAAQ